MEATTPFQFHVQTILFGYSLAWGNFQVLQQQIVTSWNSLGIQVNNEHVINLASQERIRIYILQE